MSDLDQLLAEFSAAFEAGDGADPNEWLQQVEGEERQKLDAMIDRYLMTAPRRKWDAEAYESSLAKVAFERVQESLEGVSGSWPEELPRLRIRARIKRAELVERLAGALGAGSSADVEKVASYYNRMEHGLLPAQGVSSVVLAALGDLVGTSADALRAAGEKAIPPSPLGEARAYARIASPEPMSFELADAQMSPGEPGGEPPASPGTTGRDRIDELFTAGD